MIWGYLALRRRASDLAFDLHVERQITAKLEGALDTVERRLGAMTEDLEEVVRGLQDAARTARELLGEGEHLSMSLADQIALIAVRARTGGVHAMN